MQQMARVNRPLRYVPMTEPIQILPMLSVKVINILVQALLQWDLQLVIIISIWCPSLLGHQIMPNFRSGLSPHSVLHDSFLILSMSSPAGLTLYYLWESVKSAGWPRLIDQFRSWNVVTAVILLNVLISLFSSAYSDVGFDLGYIPCSGWSFYR